MDLEARTRKVMEILTAWKKNDINEGWVSRFVLSAHDAGWTELEAVLQKIRSQGKRIEEATFGRWGSTHYRLGD